MTRTHFIGIGGRSGAGKTTVAHALALSLPEPSTEIISIDSYYHDLSHVSLLWRDEWNFDHPAALDWELLVGHLHALQRGHRIDVPSYDFRRHTRRLATRGITPGRFVIVEGVLALYHPEVRRVLSAGVFLSLDRETCLARRLERDVRERGGRPATVRRRHVETVEPMFVEYAKPTRRFADIVVEDDRPSDAVGEDLTRRILERLEGRPAARQGAGEHSGIRVCS